MWKIVFIKNNNKTHRKYENKDEALMVYEALKAHFESYLINLSKSSAPEEGFIPDFPKKTWCPYCGSPRRFKKNANRDYYLCNICDISSNDYWVKKYNNIWKYESLGGNNRKTRRAFKNLANQGDVSTLTLSGKEKRKLRRQKRKKEES